MVWPMSSWSPYVNTGEATVAFVPLCSLSEGFLLRTVPKKIGKLLPQAVYLPSLRPRLIPPGSNTQNVSLGNPCASNAASRSVMGDSIASQVS